LSRSFHARLEQQNVADLDHLAGSQDHGPFDGVGQLAHVARPGVPEEGGLGLRGKTAGA
jgi:hypothetical protein